MTPQWLEKIESAPGNGMASEASNLQDLVHGPAADRARLPLFTATAIPRAFPLTINFAVILFPQFQIDVRL
jgi:hypothetical protein